MLVRGRFSPRIKHGLHVFLGNDATDIDRHVAAAKFRGGVDDRGTNTKCELLIMEQASIGVFIACPDGE